MHVIYILASDWSINSRTDLPLFYLNTIYESKKSSSRELMLFTMHTTRDDRTKHIRLEGMEVNRNGWARK